jgi:hypothetical protein
MCNYCVITPSVSSNLINNIQSLHINSNPATNSSQAVVPSSIQSTISSAPTTVVSTVPKSWANVIKSNTSSSTSSLNSSNSSVNGAIKSASGSSLNSVPNRSVMNGAIKSASSASLSSNNSSSSGHLGRRDQLPRSSLSALNNNIKCECVSGYCGPNFNIKKINASNIVRDRYAIKCPDCNCQLRSKLFITVKKKDADFLSQSRTRSKSPVQGTNDEQTFWSGAGQINFIDPNTNAEECLEQTASNDLYKITDFQRQSWLLPYKGNYRFNFKSNIYDINTLKSLNSYSILRNEYNFNVFVHGGSNALAKCINLLIHKNIIPDYSSLVLLESGVCYIEKNTSRNDPEIYSCLQCVRYWALLCFNQIFMSDYDLINHVRKTNRFNGTMSSQRIKAIPCSGDAGWVINQNMIRALAIARNINTNEALGLLLKINDDFGSNWWQ